MYKFRNLFIVALLMSPAFPVMAADFTINVPLRVQNVPSVDMIAVRCAVSRVRVGEPTPLGGSNVVARGSKTVRPVDGAFNGTVQVAFSATGINPASSAQSYYCSLYVSGIATTGTRYSAAGNLGDIYPTATGHTLDSVTRSVKGNL